MREDQCRSTVVFHKQLRVLIKFRWLRTYWSDRIETTLTAEKTTSFKRNTTDVWPSYGYFKRQPCDFGTDKKNMPKMLVFYINQSYQSFKDEKKVYYADYFILGQVDQCLNPPENLKEYQLKENEAIINCPRYNSHWRFWRCMKDLGISWSGVTETNVFLIMVIRSKIQTFYILIIERE